MDRSIQSGQSLIEVLIAVAIGALMILAAVTLIAPSLRISGDFSRGQAVNALAKEMIERVRVFSEANWKGLATLTPSSTFYYLNTTTAPFSVVTGTEIVTLGTTTYNRYFMIEPVARDVNGNITAGVGIDDPSTKKVTVVAGWTYGVTTSIMAYLTRWQNAVAVQSDWSGGNCLNGPVTSFGNRFASSSNIDFATTTGSIVVILSATQTLPLAPSAANLVVAYPFREGGGTSVRDSKGNSTGTIEGDAVWTDGYSCYGLNMHGTHFSNQDGRVLATNSTLLAEGNQVTVMAWVKPNLAANTLQIAEKSGPSGPQWALDISNTGALSFTVKDASDTVQTALSDSASLFNDLTWHHVAGVYDGTNLFVYVDGVSVDTTPPAMTKAIRAYHYPICVGSHWDGSDCGYGTTNFDGLVDEVRIFSRGLKESEINDEMHRTDQ